MIEIMLSIIIIELYLLTRKLDRNADDILVLQSSNNQQIDQLAEQVYNLEYQVSEDHKVIAQNILNDPNSTEFEIISAKAMLNMLDDKSKLL